LCVWYSSERLHVCEAGALPLEICSIYDLFLQLLTASPCWQCSSDDFAGRASFIGIRARLSSHFCTCAYAQVVANLGNALLFLITVSITCMSHPITLMDLSFTLASHIFYPLTMRLLTL
jgi:hypothetical protein